MTAYISLLKSNLQLKERPPALPPPVQPSSSPRVLGGRSCCRGTGAPAHSSAWRRLGAGTQEQGPARALPRRPAGLVGGGGGSGGAAPRLGPAGAAPGAARRERSGAERSAAGSWRRRPGLAQSPGRRRGRRAAAAAGARGAGMVAAAGAGL